MMARWFYILCAVLIAVISVIDANGCDCSRLSVRKFVCTSGTGPCSRGMVQQAQERCLLRCKRTDPAEKQPIWQQSSTREDDKPWSDVTELQSGDSQCLLDDVYRTLTPVWQERIIKLLKEAVADSSI